MKAISLLHPQHRRTNNRLSIQQDLHKMPAPWIVLSDFDGTISLSDVTDHVLAHLGTEGVSDLEEAWERGSIGSRECMRGQIALLRATPEELDDCIDDIVIDPDFAAFVQQAEQQGIRVKVVSDGLDYAIHRILNRHGLNHLSVAANHLAYLGEDRWELQFPHAQAHCARASGNCKCARLEQRHRLGERVLYIGDGTSDYCVSGSADFILAKDKLITFCQEQGLPYQAISGFGDAMEALSDFSGTNNMQDNSYQHPELSSGKYA